MNYDEFNQWLDNLIEVEDMLILIKCKYKFETEYKYLIEYLSVDFKYDNLFIWLNDWYEGESEVEFIGFIKVSEIPMTAFNLFKEV